MHCFAYMLLLTSDMDCRLLGVDMAELQCLYIKKVRQSYDCALLSGDM